MIRERHAAPRRTDLGIGEKKILWFQVTVRHGFVVQEGECFEEDSDQLTGLRVVRRVVGWTTR